MQNDWNEASTTDRIIGARLRALAAHFGDRVSVVGAGGCVMRGPIELDDHLRVLLDGGDVTSLCTQEIDRAIASGGPLTIAELLSIAEETAYTALAIAERTAASLN